MKVETEIQIDAPAQRIWGVLTDFAAYPDWNPFLRAVRGEAAPEASLTLDLAYAKGYGTDSVIRETQAVKVTGFIAPRYLSWVWTHGFGSWWLSAEHVFRIKEREGAPALFFHEVFFTGFSMVKVLGFLDFRRDAVARKGRLSMIKMNEALKERVERA